MNYKNSENDYSCNCININTMHTTKIPENAKIKEIQGVACGWENGQYENCVKLQLKSISLDSKIVHVREKTHVHRIRHAQIRNKGVLFL